MKIQSVLNLLDK